MALSIQQNTGGLTMNQTDLTKQGQEEQRVFKPNLSTIGKIGVAIAATSAAIAYFLRMAEESIPHDPPPIIIKSGSFVIETDQDLKPAAPHQPRYRRETFGSIRGIRVIIYNEIRKYSDVDDFVENTDWSAAEGVQVNINLQYCQAATPNGECESWIQGPQINILDNTNNFELITPIKLSTSKGKKHSKRKANREDEETRISRFGSIDIIKKSNGKKIKSYEEKEGQEYIIGFYNYLYRP